MSKRNSVGKLRKVESLPSLSSQPNLHDDIDYKIIIREDVQIPYDTDQADVPELAKSKVTKALQDAELRPIGSGWMYSNSKGTTILDELDTIRADIEQLKSENLARKSENDSYGAETSKLTRQIDRLKLASAEYISIRKRFLEVYVRDKLDGDRTYNPTQPDILRGKAAAHEGDAITDATLYSEHHRKDTTVFTDLYGYGSKMVLQLQKCDNRQAIDILNAHASLKSEKGRPLPLPDTYSKAFAKYLREQEEDPRIPPQTDSNSSLGQAYHSFLRLHNSQPRVYRPS